MGGRGQGQEAERCGFLLSAPGTDSAFRGAVLLSSRGCSSTFSASICTIPPIAQSAEAVDLKSIQCGFESH